ncbi:olfactory receptor 6C74-like [Tachyglossus aculeatus]|uniref:olfactory receptor 6C74-like n=1 Tax=Tachyglossus aculeatus TaxID=9261 RepID=UPI0018F7B4F8|nr:olfactory receptor 6C74-like [Tachyglossus aculeatus]
MRNHSQVIEFILLGLTDDPDLQAVILLYMSVTYVLSITGNLTIITLTLLDTRLHTPMYFFLRCFSILEICFTSSCIPRFLATIVTGDRTISYKCCATQLFFLILLGVTEFFLLASMSYDCYVAICRPLYYTTAMSQKVCTLLVLCSCLTGFLASFPPVILGLQLDFCGSADIDHFFCDVSPLLPLSCSDTGFLELKVFIFALGTLLVTLVLVVVSYTAIACTILRLSSTQQKRKDFSTCSTYTVVVSMTYGSCIFMYMKPSAKDRVDMTKGMAVLYTTVVPMINPFTNPLRNQQVKAGHQGPGIDECDPTGNPESAMRNHTSVTEFILLGLTDNPDWKNVIFLFLLLSYLLSITDNLTILTLILLDSHLHTPFFFVIFLGETEIFLLAAMSYYRYVGNCRPLHYLTIMSRKVCTLLFLCSWLISFLIIVTGLILDLQLDFSDSKVINHFTCDTSHAGPLAH